MREEPGEGLEGLFLEWTRFGVGDSATASQVTDDTYGCDHGPRGASLLTTTLAKALVNGRFPNHRTIMGFMDQDQVFFPINHTDTASWRSCRPSRRTKNRLDDCLRRRGHRGVTPSNDLPLDC